MFFRIKVSGPRRYLQIVESFREGQKVRQRVIATLGRIDQLEESGQLESLLASGARFSRKVAIIGDHEAGKLDSVATAKLGPYLVFHRLFRETGIQSCLRAVLAKRRFQFHLEGAVFVTILHRLFDPGSDRAAEKWQQDYHLPGMEELDLQHFYRTMAWLGEPLPEKEQAGRTPFAPRCVKDEIEEMLFEQHRDLFTDLVLVFFDTTSLYFEGEGGQSLGRRGNSKDHRPDRYQMVVGLVMDSEGRPLCCEMWPGNTTDVTTLIPVVDRLRTRFHIERICVVADRGMISQTTLDTLESLGLEYILGARMRKQKEVNSQVLSRAGRYRVVRPKGAASTSPAPLKVKEVQVEGRRYVVCLNEDQAKKDANDREQIVESLKKALKKGDKSLVGNKGYRRYLKTEKPHFSIDEEKLTSEARYDGKWVLRTNSELPADQVALTYKQLWMVEAIFRTLKSILEIRPIYHKTDECIRGHVFCGFLALVLMRELQDRMGQKGWRDAEWADVLRDLDSLEETEVVTRDGKHFAIRSAVKGWCGKAFQAVGVALPPTLRPIEWNEEEMESK